MVIPIRTRTKEREEHEKLKKPYVYTGDDVFGIITDLLNLAIQLGHPLHRWQRVNVLLAPKNKGVVKANRIRYLNIFDSEVNLIRRIIIGKNHG